MPWTAGYEKDLLTDLAVHTGATVVDNEFKLKLEQVTLDHFGSAKKIVIDGNTTHIVGGSGNADKVQERLREIKEKIDSEPKNHMKQVHKDRYSRMQSRVAEIEVGGRTDSAKGEIRDHIVDSLNSAKNAMQHGILPGGGVALY